MAAMLKNLRFVTVNSPIFISKTLGVSINLLQRRNFKPKWVAPTLRELKRRKDAQDDENDRKGIPRIFHRSTFLEWNYDGELHAFGNRLGEKFNDGVLRRALTHKSYLEQEAKKLGAEPNYKLTENEELVAVGEQFISRTIKGYLRAVFSRAPEEMICALHDELVSTATLANVAKHIGLGDIILCSDFPCRDDTLAKTLQAVVAALVESTSEDNARLFVQDLIITQLYGKDVNEIWNPNDPFGVLCSIFAREGKGEPEFRLIRKTGTQTILSIYYVGIFSNKELIGTGAGENVETAKEMAARDGLKRLFHTEDAMKALPFGRQLKPILEKITKLENSPNISLDKWTSDKIVELVH